VSPELDRRIKSKRETLLARRGQLIRLLGVVLLFFSVVLAVVLVILNITGLGEGLGFLNTILIIFASIALFVLFLTSMALFLGALVAHREGALSIQEDREKTREYRDIFFGGGPTNKISQDYREAMTVADNLIRIYEDTEERVLKIFVIWGLFVLTFIIIRSIVWFSSGELSEEQATLIISFYLASPALYSGYVFYESISAEATRYLKVFKKEVLYYLFLAGIFTAAIALLAFY
jgi:hypothetical protein